MHVRFCLKGIWNSMNRKHRKDRDQAKIRGPWVNLMAETDQWFDEDQPGELDPTSTAVAEEPAAGSSRSSNERD